MPTDVDADQVVRLVRSGWTFDEVGREVGISTATAWRVAKRAAPDLRRQRSPLTDEEREAIRVLHDADFSVRAIGRIVKRSFVAIRSELRRAALPVKVTAWRCPGCGQLVATDRCLLCALTNADPGQATTTERPKAQRIASPV